MKNKYLGILSVLIVFVAMSACTSSDQKMRDQISSLEKELYNDSLMVPDAAKAKEMTSLYLGYIEKYPSDSLSPLYLFKAADLSAKTNEVHVAVQLFGKLVKEYPEHRHAPIAVFLQGFIYENQAGDPMKAKPYYEEFLQKYPDHPMAADVTFSLENLGKTPEELIRSFDSGTSDTTQAIN
jgi:outer membrane protein assembly factor BamD (BamD/ComL family)